MTNVLVLAETEYASALVELEIVVGYWNQLCKKTNESHVNVHGLLQQCVNGSAIWTGHVLMRVEVGLVSKAQVRVSGRSNEACHLSDSVQQRKIEVSRAVREGSN